MAKSKLSRLPYIHLLPRSIYRWILRKKKEPVNDLMEIRDTRISIERFEKICREQGYEVLHHRHYLLNPIYEWKFGWKPRRQNVLIRSVPYIRNFFTTCVYYIIKPQTKL